MYLLVLYFPLVSSIITGLFGRMLTISQIKRYVIFVLTLSFLVSLFIFYETALNGSYCYVKLLPWITIDYFNVDWGFNFDSLTASMLIVVTGISTLVHVYSIEYMSNDPHLKRFLSYLSLFTTFMLILVTSDNYILLFVGWEGVGICSYLLVNFWFTRAEANQSAIKAVLVNKIGDIAYILAISCTFMLLKTFDFSTIFSCSIYLVNMDFIFLNFKFNALDFIVFFLFIGCVGKSAQIGLHTWLPDAMEGPTPVSALIHAATMVTAGVFLLLRSAPLLGLSSVSMTVITIIGSITCFFAATIGTVQNDLKKVIAYSTCSQLGYMVYACGTSAFALSIFHLSNHAFFKALLFLGAGSVIHSISDEQDMRKMGGLLQIMPITYISIMVASLSLMGIPFLTGFYSKDSIIEFSFATYNFSGHFGFWLGSFSAFLTAYYSTRLLFLTFLKKTSLSKKIIELSHESNILILIPLIILFFFSIVIGYLEKELFLGFGTDTWKNVFGNTTLHTRSWELEFVPLFFKQIPLIFSILGTLLALYFYYYVPYVYLELVKGNPSIFFTLTNKYNFDTIYNIYLVKPILRFGYETTFSLIDRGYVEFIGPYGGYSSVSKLSNKFVKMQTGYIYNYSLVIIVSTVLILTILLYFYPFFFTNTILVFIFSSILLIIT